MKKERFGIYGGTFNPPHNGHIKAALSFLREMELDRLVVIPSCIPPHKKISAADDPNLRLEMAFAAFTGLSEKISVSDYEIKKENVSYTVDTLEHFARADREIFLLCGTDMFLTLGTWRSPEKIFSLCEIVCAPRNAGSIENLESKSEEYKKFYSAKCHILSSVPLEISSTELRELICAGENTDEYIPPAVRTIIEREKLYK